ncbi:MAG: HAD family hydrolase [Lachnospiraceae bacterium]|nr:HAD family hydrolase [Lachnospiraceae bacterium]
MIVSFDLDDTLFVDPHKFDTENPLRFPYKFFYKERLRLGTIQLLSKIRKNDISLWVYTTSFRSEKYIKSLFRCYGIKIDNVINGERHQKEVQGNKLQAMPSKYPSKYRIDLHIDDDVSVYQNGIRYGFKVFLIKNEDIDWVNNIWNEIEKMKEMKK